MLFIRNQGDSDIYKNVSVSLACSYGVVGSLRSNKEEGGIRKDFEKKRKRIKALLKLVVLDMRW